MTAPIVPVTGITPIYGIEYLVEGEPAFHTRQKLQRNSEKLEYLLQQRAIAPPAAADLATVSGRVTVLEGKVPGAWQAAPLRTTGTSPWSNLGGWTPSRFRLLPATNELQLDGQLASGGAGQIFQLPAGFRPASPTVVIVAHGDAASKSLFVQTTGWVELAGAATTAYLSINARIPLN